jgi:site-specific DNA recombinase
MSTKNYGYVRLNTQHQRPEGLDLEEQKQMIQKFAVDHGINLGEVMSDLGTTSTSADLPQMQELMQLAESGELSALVIARLDRLTRNIRLYADLLEVFERHGVRLVSVMEGIDSSEPAGQLALQTLAHAARWDAKRISDRTKEFIERKREQGERVGHAPYGFHYVKRKLQPLKKEIETALSIRNQRKEQGLSYHRIARYLNSNRIPSKRGGKWYAETVKAVCENVIYEPFEQEAKEAKGKES